MQFQRYIQCSSYGKNHCVFSSFSAEELRFIQTLPQAIYHQIGELLYLHCDVSYDEVLDVAFVWRHNGQLVQEKMNPRFVSVPIFDGCKRLTGND